MSEVLSFSPPILLPLLDELQIGSVYLSAPIEKGALQVGVNPRLLTKTTLQVTKETNADIQVCRLDKEPLQVLVHTTGTVKPVFTNPISKLELFGSEYPGELPYWVGAAEGLELTDQQPWQTFLQTVSALAIAKQQANIRQIQREKRLSAVELSID